MRIERIPVKSMFPRIPPKSPEFPRISLPEIAASLRKSWKSAESVKTLLKKHDSCKMGDNHAKSIKSCVILCKIVFCSDFVKDEWFVCRSVSFQEIPLSTSRCCGALGSMGLCCWALGRSGLGMQVGAWVLRGLVPQSA